MMKIGGEGWDGELGGIVPVQAEGFVDGNPFYFRARGEHWTMTIAQPGTDPVDWTASDGAGGWHRADHILYHHDEDYGEWPEAGYMELNVAEGFITRCIAEFRSQ